ncbi:MAG TPA: amidohydrolase family protein [bacterium]|nr:amidohydrolase family protein [bacterium]
MNDAVDAHAHIIVPEITWDAGHPDPWRPRVTRVAGRQDIELGGRVVRSVVNEFVRVEAVLAHLSAAGVARVVLCPWVPLLGYHLPTADAHRAGRIQNEALAGLAETRPDRIGALGTVPLQDPGVAVRELEHAVRTLRLPGVEVSASVRGVYLGDDRFRPFWEAAEALDALVFIHPTTRGFDLSVFEEYYLSNTVGNPFETTIAAAHLIMAGVLEAHPRLRILLAHGGGAILGLRGRLRHAHTFHPQARATLRESPEASLKRFYFDTVTHDPDVLRTLVDYAGADHVLLGSDYPFDMGVERPTEVVRALRLPPEDEAKILGGNAARLLGL